MIPPIKEMESSDGGTSSSNSNSNSSFTFQHKRSCVDCLTTSTPCWRGGPAGPRTLCNACGIRYRKKKKASSEVAAKSGNKKRPNPYGLVLQEEWRMNLGEEERAAILLMALSTGSVWA